MIGIPIEEAQEMLEDAWEEAQREILDDLWRSYEQD